jgi:tRNA(Leu) C34 or U34 (ribose-2'-O)-methylase TrmL
LSENYDRKSERGFCAIGIFTPRFQSNVGVLWRTAFNLGASYIFTIGKRFKYRADVTKADRHIPLFEFEDWDEFKVPAKTKLVGIEITEDAKPLHEYTHPERAIYLLGAEDYGLPQEIMDECDDIVSIESHYCLNVSATGAIVLYDRFCKSRVMQANPPNIVPKDAQFGNELWEKHLNSADLEANNQVY